MLNSNRVIHASRLGDFSIDMARTLIIGFGNPLRGDDAVGFLAAERLREHVLGADVEVLARHQLTPELMEPIGRAERVIFIDAALEGEPGGISAARVEARPDAEAAFTHFATPGALLAGARMLYGESPAAVLICITGRDFGIGDRLSEPVGRALEELVKSGVGGLMARCPWPS